MLKQRGKDLLLAALIVALVVLSSFLVIDFNRVAAQGQDGESTNAELAYSREREHGRLEVTLRRFRDREIDYAALHLCEDLNGMRPVTLDRFHFPIRYQVQ